MANLSGNSARPAYGNLAAAAATNPRLPQTQVSSQFWGSPVFAAEDGRHFCPGFDGETYATNVWDYLTIGGIKTPGVAKVHVEKERDLDVKKPLGKHHARITSYGAKVAEVQIEIMIWTPEQFRQLTLLWGTTFDLVKKAESFASTVAAAPFGKLLGGTLVQEAVHHAFDVAHPVLTYNGVRSIVIKKLKGPEEGPIPRSRMFTIDAVEYRPMQNKNGSHTVRTSKSAPQLGTVYDSPAGTPTPGSNPTDLGPQ